MTDLLSRVALVSGPPAALAAIALTLAEAGATIAVNYWERIVDAEAIADAIRQKGGTLKSFPQMFHRAMP